MIVTSKGKILENSYKLLDLKEIYDKMSNKTNPSGNGLAFVSIEKQIINEFDK